MDADVGGIAVHIAARILGHAGGGEIVVSRTVRDLVVGSGIGFDDRGTVELRGYLAAGNCWPSTHLVRRRIRLRQSW